MLTDTMMTFRFDPTGVLSGLLEPTDTETTEGCKDVRSITIEGEPRLAAIDVCRALDIQVMKDGGVNTTRALAGLASKHKSFHSMKGLNGPGVYQMQRIMCIDEAGLYRLIMRSNKPEAVAFQEWVTAEVLPTIRKTGGYMLKGADRFKIGESLKHDRVPMPTKLSEAFERMAEQQKEIEALEETSLRLHLSHSVIKPLGIANLPERPCGLIVS